MILDFVAGKVARLPWALPCVTGVGFVGLLGFFWEGVGGVVFFSLVYGMYGLRGSTLFIRDNDLDLLDTSLKAD